MYLTSMNCCYHFLQYWNKTPLDSNPFDMSQTIEMQLLQCSLINGGDNPELSDCVQSVCSNQHKTYEISHQVLLCSTQQKIKPFFEDFFHNLIYEICVFLLTFFSNICFEIFRCIFYFSSRRCKLNGDWFLFLKRRPLWYWRLIY